MTLPFPVLKRSQSGWASLAPLGPAVVRASPLATLNAEEAFDVYSRRGDSGGGARRYCVPSQVELARTALNRGDHVARDFRLPPRGRLVAHYVGGYLYRWLTMR